MPSTRGKWCKSHSSHFSGAPLEKGNARVWYEELFCPVGPPGSSTMTYNVSQRPLTLMQHWALLVQQWHTVPRFRFLLLLISGFLLKTVLFTTASANITLLGTEANFINLSIAWLPLRNTSSERAGIRSFTAMDSLHLAQCLNHNRSPGNVY